MRSKQGIACDRILRYESLKAIQSQQENRCVWPLSYEYSRGLTYGRDPTLRSIVPTMRRIILMATLAAILVHCAARWSRRDRQVAED